MKTWSFTRHGGLDHLKLKSWPRQRQDQDSEHFWSGNNFLTSWYIISRLTSYLTCQGPWLIPRDNCWNLSKLISFPRLSTRMCQDSCKCQNFFCKEKTIETLGQNWHKIDVDFDAVETKVLPCQDFLLTCWDNL